MSKQEKENVCVVFGEELPSRLLKLKNVSVLLAKNILQEKIQEIGLKFVSIDSFIEAGSIYEGSAFAEELSNIKLPNDVSVPKSFLYEGYELWWMHYNNLFLYFGLPYTQYKKLLEHLKDFEKVYFYEPPYKSLFSCYLKAHGCDVVFLSKSGFKNPFKLPFGVFIQIIITLISIPFLIFGKRYIMIFTGDKFEESKDYDFRMKFIYEELRKRNLPFVEFIRSLESWKFVIGHAIKRRRPVIYSEAVAFVGRFFSFISGGHYIGRKKFGDHNFISINNKEDRFKIMVANQYMISVYDDVWAIRIMRFILRIIGVRSAFIAATLERNFHSVLGCKLNKIPIIGILHGVASSHYNVYDFLPGFNGDKVVSVDKYGLWSDWWKEYYLKNSRAYKSEQLYVSGPMRPLIKKEGYLDIDKNKNNSRLKVLFVSEQLAVPEEVLPYLESLLEEDNISVYLVFRHYRDNFEIWLKNNHPEVIAKFDDDKILRNGINDAISKCDVVVGSHSTAVLEALFELKPIIFFNTKKWGDYFDLKNYNVKHKFFTKNSEDLISCLKKSKDISVDILKELQERFFGDPYKNGSKWVVDELEKSLQKN